MDPFEPRWTPRAESEEALAARLAEARRRGDAIASEEPCAKAIVFHPAERRFSLTLMDGTSISFSADALPELAEKSPEDLSAVEIIPSRTGLSWRSLDLDIAVSGLVLALLDKPEWKRAIRQAANRYAARTPSEARIRASRENGKKGGRPRKAAGL